MKGLDPFKKKRHIGHRSDTPLTKRERGLRYTPTHASLTHTMSSAAYGTCPKRQITVPRGCLEHSPLLNSQKTVVSVVPQEAYGTRDTASDGSKAKQNYRQVSPSGR